jgi:hypothetical protein
MTTSLLIITAMLASPAQAVPVALIEGQGFRFLGNTPAARFDGGAGMYFNRQNPSAKLTVNLRTEYHAPSRKLDLFRDPMGPASLEGLGPTSPSSLPIGFDWLYRNTLGSMQIFARSEREEVSVTYTPAGTFGGSRPGPVNEPTAAAFVERVARVTLARAAGLRLEAPRQTQLEGTAVTLRRDASKGIDHVDVRQWASARGWSVQLDSDSTTLTLSRSGKSILLPLASGTMRVGTAWRDAGDVVAQADNRWFAPFKALEDAR